MSLAFPEEKNAREAGLTNYGGRGVALGSWTHWKTGCIPPLGGSPPHSDPFKTALHWLLIYSLTLL